MNKLVTIIVILSSFQVIALGKGRNDKLQIGISGIYGSSRTDGEVEFTFDTPASFPQLNATDHLQVEIEDSGSWGVLFYLHWFLSQRFSVGLISGSNVTKQNIVLISDNTTSFNAKAEGTTIVGMMGMQFFFTEFLYIGLGGGFVLDRGTVSPQGISNLSHFDYAALGSVGYAEFGFDFMLSKSLSLKIAGYGQAGETSHFERTNNHGSSTEYKIRTESRDISFIGAILGFNYYL